MKKITCVIFLLVTLSVFTTCDKWDCNGNLDGMWQMTEWWQTRDGNQELIAVKDSQIYYSFQLSMVRFQRYHKDKYRMIQASFSLSVSQLKVYNPLGLAVNHHETFRDMKELSVFGVPESGIFRIEYLSSDRFVLVSEECKDSLIFRKY